VRGVFTIAPALGPAFRRDSLTKISVPVQIVAGVGDINIPVGSGAKYLAATIPAAKLVIYSGTVGHYVFLDSCTEQGRKSAPILCSDPVWTVMLFTLKPLIQPCSSNHVL
jgi:predicted dienelactone hydrolase